MKKLIIIYLLFLSVKIFANGGPIDGCAVYKQNTIIALAYSDIDLVKEDLNIKIEGDYSLVEVIYQLKANEYGYKNLTYGFPIDFENGGYNYKFEWRKDYVPQIEFFLNNKKLKIKHQQVDYSVLKEKRILYDDEENITKIKRKWYVVDFDMEKNKISILKIKYKIMNSYEDDATTKSFFPYFGERLFLYDFRPAMNWGDGKVSEFNIKIDAQEVYNRKDSIFISGLSLTDSLGKYSASFKNFDFSKSSYLKITYENSQKMSEFIKETRISKEKIKNVKVFSQLSDNYSKDKMFDFDFNTAWSEGVKGDGVGEKIEIELNDCKLGAICLLNGYSKNAEVYKNNNRIKKIKVDIEYAEDTIIKSYECNLKDLEYQTISLQNFESMLDYLGDYGEGFRKVKKITLTILEVYKGDKYDDTCISEIFLLSYEK